MNIIKRLCLALTAIFAASGAFAQSEQYLDALNLYHHGKKQEACKAFRSITETDRENDAAFYYLALLSDDTFEAEEAFKHAVELDPDNFWYSYSLATLYSGAGRNEEATAILTQLIEKFPKRSSLYFDLINLYVNANDYDNALSALDVIEQKSGKSEAIALTRMDLLVRQDKIKEAYEYLESYYNDFQSAKLACVLGDYYRSMYRDQDALKMYSDALEMDPDCTEAFFSKAHMHRAAGQYDLYFENIGHFISDSRVNPQAKVEYMENLLQSQEFVRTFMPQIDTMVYTLYNYSPADSSANAFTSAYFWQRGKADEAINVASNYLRLFPEKIDAHFNQAILYYYAEDWHNAINSITVALQKFPGQGSLDLLNMRGVCYWQIKEYDSAIADYSAMLTIAPRDSSAALAAHTALGDLYHLKGDAKKSFANYDKALKINPSYVPVLNNYAYYISESYPEPVKKAPKDLRKAQQMSRKTVEAEPDNPTYLDTYAWILHLCGQDVEAKALFKHAMIYGGKESKVILEHYAKVLEALGENGLANIYFKQARTMKNVDE